MSRSLGYTAFLLAAAFCFAATPELPKSDDVDSFDIEPPLLIPNRDREKLDAQATPAPIVDLAKLEKDFERAKRNASGAARLCKMGVIAQVEVEQRALRVARVEAQLENARLAEAKENFAQEQSRLTNHEISGADLAEAEATLAHAIESAHAAEARHNRAEMEFAENNVRRQQKLAALGSGSKSAIARAEQKLNELKTPKENN
jgi:multidrug resistance efflux pump